MMIETSELVHAAYQLLLSRDPEPAALRHWSHMLDNGLSRVEFVRAVLASREFRQHMAEVGDLTKYRDVDLIIPVDGRRFMAPASDVSLVPHLLRERRWEPHILSYLTRTLRPEDVFMDAGANVGYFTVLCAARAARVIAFEPVESTHRYCAANIELNGVHNVELWRCGLWHEDTTLHIRSDSSSVMTAAITAQEEPAVEVIEAVSLDSLIRRGLLDLPRLDILKMDIEGAEVSALTGMRETLTRLRPTIVMEVNRPLLAAMNVGVEDVWNFLGGLSYRIAVFEAWKEQDARPIDTLDDLEQACPADGLVDILAYRPGGQSAQRNFADASLSD
jgi:FkbM family methyltransferase